LARPKVEQHVLRLHVAMDHAARVRVDQRVGKVRDQPGHAPEPCLVPERDRSALLLLVRRAHQVADHAGQVHLGEPARRLRADPREHLAQRDAVHELHRVVVIALALADGVDGHDVRVAEPRGDPRFAAEPLDRAPGPGERGAEHLERDHATERELLGLEHDAHPAPADLADDPEVAEHRVLGRRGALPLEEAVERLQRREPVAQELPEMRVPLQDLVGRRPFPGRPAVHEVLQDSFGFLFQRVHRFTPPRDPSGASPPGTRPRPG
jgi:hypothetical protein